MSTSIRPEFQLINIINPVTCFQYGVSPEQIVGRLYFTKNCKFEGTFKGKILYDSRNSKSYKNNGYFEIIFIAAPEMYNTLYKSCGKSSMAVNRIRTFDLLKKVCK